MVYAAVSQQLLNLVRVRDKQSGIGRKPEATAEAQGPSITSIGRLGLKGRDSMTEKMRTTICDTTGNRVFFCEKRIYNMSSPYRRNKTCELNASKVRGDKGGAKSLFTQ